MEEILRCGGTVPIGDHEAIQDTVLLGHHIPKGTMVFFLHNGPSMRSPALDIDESKRSARSQAAKAEGQVRAWDDEDMALFKLKRWLVSNGDDVAFDCQAGPNIPFGLGLRACFGRRLAYVKFRILLTLLVWNFEMLPCPEEVVGYGGLDAVAHKPAKCYDQLWRVE